MEFLSIVFLALTIIAIVLIASALMNRRRIRKGHGVSSLGWRIISAYQKRVESSGRKAGRNLKLQAGAAALFSLLFIGNVVAFVLFLILPFVVISLHKAWENKEGSDTPAPSIPGGPVPVRPGEPNEMYDKVER